MADPKVPIIIWMDDDVIAVISRPNSYWLLREEGRGRISGPNLLAMGLQ